MKITFDTNIAERDDLVALATSKSFSVRFSSVTDRELEGSDIVPGSEERIIESAVWDETRYGQGVWAGDDEENLFEKSLAIISQNSFPKKGSRRQLTDGQRRQLRDAMIFANHVREKGEVFVSDDKKAFVENGRREKLMALGKTKILTSTEFKSEFQG